MTRLRAGEDDGACMVRSARARGRGGWRASGRREVHCDLVDSGLVADHEVADRWWLRSDENQWSAGEKQTLGPRAMMRSIVEPPEAIFDFPVSPRTLRLANGDAG